MLPKRKVVWASLLLLTLSSPAFAQPAAPPPPARRFFNPTLGWVGVITMATGGALMVPWKTDPGAHDVNLFGVDRCVIYDTAHDIYDIQNNWCATTTPRIKAGLITLGIGGALALVGFHKVTVAPQVGHRVVGASVSVKW